MQVRLVYHLAGLQLYNTKFCLLLNRYHTFLQNTWDKSYLVNGNINLQIA